jgi:hypothetical protein
MKYSAASVQLLPPPAESPDISAMSFLLGNFVNYIYSSVFADGVEELSF